MSEAAVVNLFTVLRVLLVGGILFILPMITRKGLLFGVYVGEKFAEGETAKRFVRRWYHGCLIVMGVSLTIGLGISFTGWPVVGNLTATALLLLGFLGFYLWLYYSSLYAVPAKNPRQTEIPPSPRIQTPGHPKGVALAWSSLGLSLLAGIAGMIYAAGRYAEIPDPLPMSFITSGELKLRFDKSYTIIMWIPFLNLLLGPFIAWMALLSATAKRSIRGGSGGRSSEAQDAFRTAVANLLSGAALFMSLLMTYLSVQMIRVAVAEAQSFETDVGLISILMVLYVVGGIILIATKYGQGGAHLEEGSGEAPLTEGLADNDRWIWGALYFNRSDPAIMIEKRFGLGYTFNFGNLKTILGLATFLLLFVGFAVFAIIETIL